MSKVVSWFSRHEMTDPQREDLIEVLSRHFGINEEVMIRQTSKTATSWRDIAEAGRDAEILCVVAPPDMLAELTKPANNTKPVLRAISKRVPTGREVSNPATGKTEPEYMFVHQGWEQVVRMEMITRRLSEVNNSETE